MQTTFELKPLGLIKSIIIYSLFGLVLYFACFGYMPYLIKKFDSHPLLAWHISGGIVFIMLFASAISAFIAERALGLRQSLWSRFRLFKLSKTDIKWTIYGLLSLYILSGLVFYIALLIFPNFQLNPAFMDFSLIKPVEWWLLLTWAFMFFFNIVGEEIFWRGYMFPKQQLKFGNYTWVINSAGWMIFHFAFGWQMMILLLPTIIIIPYIMQKRNNTTIGIILHSTFNGLNYLIFTLQGFLN